jgi:hypothetical protein
MNEKITATRQECMKFSQEENFRTYINDISIYFYILNLLFFSYRKDEIERLRRDLGHTQRSIAAPPPPLPPPQAVKPTATQQDMDYVCIDLFKKKIDFYFHIILLSIERFKR